jgi:hypothetical protein
MTSVGGEREIEERKLICIYLGGRPGGGEDQSRPMTSVGAAGYRSEAKTAAGGRTSIMDPMNGIFVISSPYTLSPSSLSSLLILFS